MRLHVHLARIHPSEVHIELRMSSAKRRRVHPILDIADYSLETYQELSELGPNVGCPVSIYELLC